jgi:hypothetical protein
VRQRFLLLLPPPPPLLLLQAMMVTGAPFDGFTLCQSLFQLCFWWQGSLVVGGCWWADKEKYICFAPAFEFFPGLWHTQSVHATTRNTRRQQKVRYSTAIVACSTA